MGATTKTNDSASDTRRGLSSVTNALRVLEYLVEAHEAGVSEISRHVGITVGTAHRLVGTLVMTGFAEQNPANRKYLAGRKLVTLAQRAQQNLDAREIAHRHLVELVSSVQETGNMAILDDNMVFYTDKVTSDQPFGIEARVGSRLPAYCTALGKVLLAGLDAQRLTRYLQQMKASSHERRMPRRPTEAALKGELRHARELGYALDRGEYLADVYCAAAPIVNAEGIVVAAMSLSVPRSRFYENEETFVREVREHATGLSQALSELGLGRSPLELVPPDLR